jgi:hypothetical protein
MHGAHATGRSKSHDDSRNTPDGSGARPEHNVARARTRWFDIPLAAIAVLTFVAAPASAQSSFGAGFVHTDQNPLGPGFNLNAYVTLPAARSVRVGVDFTYFRSAVDTLTLFGESFDFRLRLWELSTNLRWQPWRRDRDSVGVRRGLR